ncbi:2-dehydro-3-deoxygalactonokinase [Brevundimonas sp. UBA7534]|uniref:2-dehydro-3-deoxygalactonokinase n=1 Tax=Brevundimonas sp. UBA7534 TaxID=1946138 RepID=UPI0025B9F858|nr:2-dehydro-3-deoxygalactonokinase [Brevundimonas sp. UBA7534]
MTELIGVDWGTSNLRIMRLGADGAVLDRRVDPRGAGRLASDEFVGVLQQAAGDWLALAPVLIAGMAGSRQGWVEAPYAFCPAGAEDLAARLARPDAARDIRIVPGVALTPRGLGDVMRGEETQALGLFGAGDSGLMVAPGSHSKWVRVENGAINGLRTHLTGELFAAVRQATLIGRDMGEPGADDTAFDEGVQRALSDPALTAHLFTVRVRRLADELSQGAAADFLSGLLIGAELAAEGAHRDQTVQVVGEAALAQRYVRALALAGFTDVGVAAGETAVARGLHRIWKAIP